MTETPTASLFQTGARYGQDARDKSLRGLSKACKHIDPKRVGEKQTKLHEYQSSNKGQTLPGGQSTKSSKLKSCKNKACDGNDVHNGTGYTKPLQEYAPQSVAHGITTLNSASGPQKVSGMYALLLLRVCTRVVPFLHTRF